MLCLLVSQRDQEDRARCLVTENQVMNLIPSGTGQEMLPEKMCQDQHHRVHLMVLDWEDQTRGLVMDLDRNWMGLVLIGHGANQLIQQMSLLLYHLGAKKVQVVLDLNQGKEQESTL
jgi:hypothetical protein